MSKEYGLIIPGKNKMVVQAPGKRASIFDEESDSDDSTVNEPSFLKPIQKKQTKITQDRAIAEDPTIYQYDEIYDDMDKKRKESKLSKKDVDRKPKYITNLLKAAEHRKKENERRIERQVQKEREAEGDEFKDKESYITPSYQKKLEEMKALEEKEKRDEYLESIGDVRKQGNLDGFYRHLYDQKVNYEDQNVVTETEVKKEVEEKDLEETKLDSTEKDIKSNKRKKTSRKRQYRVRDQSNSEEEVEVKKEHIPSNLDADSDFSIDSSDSEDDNASKIKKEKVEESKDTKQKNDDNIDQSSAAVLKQENIEDNKEHIQTEEKLPEIEKPKKPKIDIWKKRTVGEVFEAARTRYFERRALRESG